MSATGVPAVDLTDVEAAVQDALVSARADHLAVLGYGEITLVVGWPTEAPAVACKRLPEFPSEAAASVYRVQFDRYLDLLRERGVTPVPSEFRTVPARGGRMAGYVVQPVLAAGTLGPDVLRAVDPDPAHPLVRAVCRAVPAVVDERTGIDGQIANWAVVGSGPSPEVQYLDVSTPMLFRSDRIELDTGLFLAAYPWPLRRPIDRFVVPGVIGSFRDPRYVLVDMTGNLIKEGLGHWVPAVLEVVNELVTPAVTEDEVQKFYRSDARLWEVLLRLRRADRWWQRNVRRRPYPFLLPGHIER
jgi:hypothetical protein